MAKKSPAQSVSRPPSGARVAIVVSRWNGDVTEALLAGARARLGGAGIGPEAVDVVHVPGSFELPLAADRLAATGGYAAVLCLGAIIRGETSHDRHIATAVALGIEQVGRARGLPVLFGVLTCDTAAQAAARSVVPGAGADWDESVFARNKGSECAAAAVEMMALVDRIDALAR